MKGKRMVSNLNIYKNSYDEKILKLFAQLQHYLIKSLSMIWKQSANWEGWAKRSGQEGGPRLSTVPAPLLRMRSLPSLGRG